MILMEQVDMKERSSLQRSAGGIKKEGNALQNLNGDNQPEYTKASKGEVNDAGSCFTDGRRRVGTVKRLCKQPFLHNKSV